MRLLFAHKTHYAAPAQPRVSYPLNCSGALTPWTWYPGRDAAFALWCAELRQVERVLQIQLPFSLEKTRVHAC